MGFFPGCGVRALNVCAGEGWRSVGSVLTDGAPSAGKERTRSGILSAVAHLNRYRKAVIHTVEIGGETAGKKWKGFLAELAARNGGIHVRR